MKKSFMLVCITLFCLHLATIKISGQKNNIVYEVLINGKPVSIYQGSVWNPGYVPSYGGPYWFCSFEVTGETAVEVVTSRALNNLELLPKSKGVIPIVSGQKISFNISKPMQLVLELDGKNGPLMLFANGPEKNIPKEGDPNLIYYGPGEHNVGAIELTDNQTLYLAEGAVVSGGIHAKGKNITIRGRGVLDGIAYERSKGPIRYPVFLEDCQNVTVEGIVIKDSWIWTFVMRGCKGVYVDNVKSLSPRVENGDGIDIVNSQDVTVINSFVRSDDDCIAIKGMGAANRQGCANILFENCILWSDRAHVWRLGAEVDAEYFRNLVFKNIDVLHFPDLWTYDEVPFCISLEPANELPIENVLFQDIRVRTSGQKGFIDVRPKVTMFAGNKTPGSISNVIFRNISFTGPQGSKPGMVRVSGPDPDHSVSNISFENVTYNTEPITVSSSNVSLLGNITNVIFKSIKQHTKTGGTELTNITLKQAPRTQSHQFVEACKARGAIYATDGITGTYKLYIEQMQDGIMKAIKATMPVITEPYPVKRDGQKMIIIGDCQLAKDEGLDGTALPSGGFEIKTYPGGVIIVGNGDGLKKGVEVFLEYFLGYKKGYPLELRTDLIVASTWIVSK
jgi:hypothetical protein